MGKTLPGERGACLKCEYLRMSVYQQRHGEGHGCICVANGNYNSHGRELVRRTPDPNHAWNKQSIVSKGYSREVLSAAKLIIQEELARQELEYLETHINPSWCPKRKACD